ncbi:MAG TPA: hypothetical protein PLB51_01160 [Candidatus Paceibacterota bacterium]|nr:hypothetical protein [Candidatus Paceibacterota bacterium]
MTIITFIVMCLASLRVGFEFRDHEWDFTTTMWLSSGVILLAFSALYYLAKKQDKYFSDKINKQKGLAVPTEDVFEVGEIVKVMATDKYRDYTILKSILTAKAKFVEIPIRSHGIIAVGKHYQIGSRGELIDFIEAGKRSEKNIELVEEN